MVVLIQNLLVQNVTMAVCLTKPFMLNISVSLSFASLVSTCSGLFLNKILVLKYYNGQIHHSPRFYFISLSLFIHKYTFDTYTRYSRWEKVTFILTSLWREFLAVKGLRNQPYL